MPLQPIQFAYNSYEDRSPPASIQRLVNLYPELKPKGLKTPVALYGSPGLNLWTTVGTGPIRGMIRQTDGTLLVVSGESAYQIDADKNATFVGTIEGTGPVRMATNWQITAIVAYPRVYQVQAAVVTELAPTNVNDVVVQDSYFVFVERNTQRMFISNLVESATTTLTFNALEDTTVDARPDNTVAIRSANRELWVFGERSTEIFYNAGELDFPFVRNPTGVIDRGCYAVNSAVEYQGAVFWLGDDLRIYRNQGYAALPISTNPIDKKIAEYAEPENAIGFIYQQEGHVFYVLTFTEGTWVYDVGIGSWHERESWELTRWRVDNYVFLDTAHLVGDYVNGNIYSLDLDKYDENGDPLIRTAISPPITGANNRIMMSSFYLDVETGVGLNSGQGSIPQVMLDWSDDGGRTFTSIKTRTIGQIGEYKTRVRWFRLGSFYERSLRVRISDPVKTTVLRTYGNFKPGVY